MAALHTHLQKALSARAKREAAHQAAVIRQAGMAATRADLAAAAAAAGKVPTARNTPPERKAP